jgi:hypothetical protein
MAGMVPLTPEDYYLVVLFLGGGFSYLTIGTIMAANPRRWLQLSFSLLPETQRRAKAARITRASDISIRLLGTCFALMSAMMVHEGIKHALYIHWRLSV